MCVCVNLNNSTAQNFSTGLGFSSSSPFFLSSFFLILVLLSPSTPAKMNISKSRIWINQPSPTPSAHFLSLPKEILFDIISYTATTDDDSSNALYPPSLTQLSLTCRYLHYFIHKDPWRLKTLWPRTFRSRFDTDAIVRRRLHRRIHWQCAFEERCRVLFSCRNIAALIITEKTHDIQQQTQQQQQDLARLLDNVDWQIIWTIITEHGKQTSTKKLASSVRHEPNQTFTFSLSLLDALNIYRLFDFKVPLVAGAAFQLGYIRDREVYPVVLPILSLLVNYGKCNCYDDVICARLTTGRPKFFRLLYHSVFHFTCNTSHRITGTEPLCLQL